MKSSCAKWLNVTVGTALFFALSLTVSTTHAHVLSVGHAVARPLLRHARPLHGHNALLKVTADQGDIIDPVGAPPALCATYKRNPYANAAPNVDMINRDTTVQVGTLKGCKAPQDETTIAVNPENPNNIVAGTNDYRIYNAREKRNDGSGWAYTSQDGGTTWRDVLLPHLTFQTGATGPLSDMDAAGDPAISFGPHNTIYYANIAFSRLNKGSAIVVSISHDGGLHWGEPSIVHTDGVDAAGHPLATNIFDDKVWVAVDPKDGATAYVTWTQFYSDAAGNTLKSPIVLSITHNSGATWSAPVQVNPAFTPGGISLFSTGSLPQVDQDAELYIAYESSVCQTPNCNSLTDHDAIIMAKSRDGGSTFTSTQVDVDYDFPVNPHIQDASLTGENFRINSFPQFSIDRVTGRLYVTWADDRNGEYDANGNSIKTNGDVFVATSRNGTEWEKPLQLGTQADEVFPAIAASNGHILVSFYTRFYAATGINLDYAYSKLSDEDNGGLAYEGIVRLTGQSENPRVQFVAADALDKNRFLQGVFIGDYSAVAVGIDGAFHPCWTDFRGSSGKTLPNQDAYTQSV